MKAAGYICINQHPVPFGKPLCWCGCTVYSPEEQGKELTPMFLERFERSNRLLARDTKREVK
jgi:hypothetical protein